MSDEEEIRRSQVAQFGNLVDPGETLVDYSEDFQELGLK